MRRSRGVSIAATVVAVLAASSMVAAGVRGQGHAPGNDACSSATVVVPGRYQGTTAGATNDAAANCAESAAGPDVWYSFTPAEDCGLTVDTCGSSYDTALTIHTSCPGTAANQIACNDDADCDGDGQIPDDGYVSRVRILAQAGTTYRIRVSGYQGASGAFVLNVACSPLLQSDTCTAAVELPEGSSQVGTTTGATADGSASCGAAASPDVWFRFTPVEPCLLRAETCGSTLDTVLSVHASCPGTSSSELACNDDTCASGSRVELPAAPGQTYRLRVAGANGATGVFGLGLSCRPQGPDARVGELSQFEQFGRLGDRVGCALDSPVCNAGTAPLDWYPLEDGRHPFMAFNLYRLRHGRFEQIGKSWIKHGYGSAQSDACGLGCRPYPDSTHTGVGCSDTYNAELNADQTLLGPRDEVNPWTGSFTWTGSYLDTHGGPWNPVEHRLELRDADLDASLNPSASYFAEFYVVTHDDVDPLNSIGWEPVTVSGSPGGVWQFDSAAATHIGPALEAWPGATRTVLRGDPAADGRAILAAQVTANGNGTWHYEYALYNHDLDRQVRSFSVSRAAGVAVTNLEFHAPGGAELVHSQAPWTSSVGPTAVTWRTGTFAEHPLTNPLRWGTAYSFRFDASAPPVESAVVLELYKPDGPAAVSGLTLAPGPATPSAAGSVPALQMSREPDGRIELAWGASCAATDTDYAIYDGALGAFASHASLLCSTSGATEAVLAAPPGNRYYLVVPHNGYREGSYGEGSGAPRPAALAACLQQLTASCE